MKRAEMLKMIEAVDNVSQSTTETDHYLVSTY